MNLYFESAGTILTLITLGKTLEAKAKGKTTDAISKLLNLAPKMARVLRDNQEKNVPVEEVKKAVSEEEMDAQLKAKLNI